MRHSVAFVTALPPSQDNLRGPTALPYQLLKHAPDDIDIDLFFFPGAKEAKSTVNEDISRLRLGNVTEISRASPRKLSFQRFYRKLCPRRPLLPEGVSRFPVNRRIVKEVNAVNRSAVWLYPHWLIDWFSALRCGNIVVTGPDSAVLHSERVIRFGKWSSYEEIVGDYEQLLRNVELERRWGQTSARVHMVGREDVRKYEAVTRRPAQATFIRYPHHRYCETTRCMTDSGDRLRVVISGSSGGRSVYVGDHLTRAARALMGSAEQLRDRYEFSIIGTGYEELVPLLRESGYTVTQHDWVDDYAAEVANAHIQFFPIAVGTGTKGKVLGALVTGLLGIGSAFSYENICVDLPGDALMYERPEEIAEILVHVDKNRSYFEELRRSTAAKVRVAHAPERVAMDFWTWVLDGRLSISS